MANTYTQLYAHVVFAVKYRAALITPEIKEEVYKYISGIVSRKKQKLMIINGMPDHLHLLIGFSPDCSISELVREIKANSSRWINENNLVNRKFEWQVGFGAFTVGQSQVPRVLNYIINQENHHKKKSFRDEYVNSLQTNNIDYREKYIFEDLGDNPSSVRSGISIGRHNFLHLPGGV